MSSTCDNDGSNGATTNGRNIRFSWPWMMASILLVAGLILAICLLVLPRDEDETNLSPILKPMGPMVGHIMHDSVTLWASQPPVDTSPEDEQQHIIQATLYNEMDQVVTVESFSSYPDASHVFLMNITSLQPATVYKYTLHMPQKGNVGSGQFRTAPDQSSNGTAFDYVLASCMNAQVYPQQLAWSHILKNNNDTYPHFALLAGDTIYLRHGVDIHRKDGVLYNRVWYRHQQQRKDAHFTDFIANTPIYSTWNNHDYGRGYATKDQEGKEQSLKAWKLLWGNPEYASQANGVYYSFYYGDVHFLILDDHWNRDPALGNRLGSVQTEWIRQELIQSTGTFKVLVLGSDIMQRGWTSDLTKIGAIVTQHRIEGVLFHAGDIHRNEYKVQEYADVWPYPVHQITSSGIAMVPRKPYVHIKVDTMASTTVSIIH